MRVVEEMEDFFNKVVRLMLF